jgi:redox-sensitive bicupin YhaK (pirin superfamily)
MTQQSTNFEEFRPFDRPSRLRAASPRVRVVRKANLAHDSEGPTRGWAHIGFEGYPAQAPGRLDFDPLLLFAEGMMHDGEGFAMHRHEGIENVLLVLDGCVEHRGSDGSHWSLERDDVFLMSAGSGGEHEEFARAETHALVIWLRSAEPDAPCRFDRTNVPWRSTPGFCVLASGGSRRAGGLELRRDAAVLRADLDAGSKVTYQLAAGRRAYLIALDGPISVNDEVLESGERLMAEGPGPLRICGADRSRVVLVDMD